MHRSMPRTHHLFREHMLSDRDCACAIADVSLHSDSVCAKRRGFGTGRPVCVLVVRPLLMLEIWKAGPLIQASRYLHWGGNSPDSGKLPTLFDLGPFIRHIVISRFSAGTPATPSSLLPFGHIPGHNNEDAYDGEPGEVEPSR